jgi:hypothetical protein
MYQTANTPDNEKFWTALTNMQFALCTKQDLQYLQSRTISKGPNRPTFVRSEFRGVSIITAFNTQKDKINELGTAKFAKEHGQALTTFYSDDSVAGNVGNSQRKPKDVRKRNTVKARVIIPEHCQQQLWDAHPCFAGAHIPGKLNICLGLPVMIKNNNVTELCITKGQEGKVVGWQEAVGNRDQKVLDTLFVELISPPKTVQIRDLPNNVVALPQASKKIWCTLPDDRTMQISREQVLVLPNFAMTDYASQGETRDINVLDLNNCKDHLSYYTALSRSATSEGTVILQGMHPWKITKGINGFLRQEFRELELLNEITRQRYEGELPLPRQRYQPSRSNIRLPSLERT